MGCNSGHACCPEYWLGGKAWGVIRVTFLSRTRVLIRDGPTGPYARYLSLGVGGKAWGVIRVTLAVPSTGLGVRLGV